MTHAITIYSRPGCHLCTEMKQLVERVTAGTNASLVEIDVDRTPDLARLYGHDVPVLFVDGRKIAKYRVDRAQLERALRMS